MEQSRKKIIFIIIGAFLMIGLVSVIIIYVVSSKEKETTANNEPDYSVGAEFVGGDEVLEENESYSINKFEYDGEEGFIILIGAGNPPEVRISAEEKLLEKRAISKEFACNMNVSLFVAEEVSKELANKNYGLSFCPDGKDFEEIKGL